MCLLRYDTGKKQNDNDETSRNRTRTKVVKSTQRVKGAKICGCKLSGRGTSISVTVEF